MKKLISILLAMAILSSLVFPVYAYEWDYGENISYTKNEDSREYKFPSWAPDIVTTYQDPNESVYKGDVALVILRIIQNSLKREGYQTLKSKNHNAYDFNDINTLYASALDEVQILLELGAIKGTPENELQFNKIISRAECAAMLSRMNKIIKLPSIHETIKFKDMSNHWAVNLAEYACEIGLMKGDDKQNFNPNNSLSLSELVTILSRFTENPHIKNEDIIAGLNQTFKVTENVNKIARVRFSENKIELKLHETAKLKIEILPENAKLTTEFKSSDSEIVMVDSSGKIVALKEGSCKVTVIASNNTSDIIEIVVTDTKENNSESNKNDTENNKDDAESNKDDTENNKDDLEEEKPILYIENYEPQEYHNCFTGESFNLIVKTKIPISYCSISNNLVNSSGYAKIEEGYLIPLIIADEQGTSKITVNLTDGTTLFMDFYIYE